MLFLLRFSSEEVVVRSDIEGKWRNMGRCFLSEYGGHIYTCSNIEGYGDIEQRRLWRSWGEARSLGSALVVFFISCGSCSAHTASSLRFYSIVPHMGQCFCMGRWFCLNMGRCFCPHIGRHLQEALAMSRGGVGTSFLFRSPLPTSLM